MTSISLPSGKISEAMVEALRNISRIAKDRTENARHRVDIIIEIADGALGAHLAALSVPAPGTGGADHLMLERARDWIADNIREGDMEGCTVLGYLAQFLHGSATPPAGDMGAVKVKPHLWKEDVDTLIRELAEMDDRTSPEDRPEHLLVTTNELRQFASDVSALSSTPVREMDGWQPIETAPKDQEVLIAYWRWRNSMSPGTIVVQSASLTEHHGKGIWSWVVSDNKHGPFPIRGWCDGDLLGWQPLPEFEEGRAALATVGGRT